MLDDERGVKSAAQRLASLACTATLVFTFSIATSYAHWRLLVPHDSAKLTYVAEEPGPHWTPRRATTYDDINTTLCPGALSEEARLTLADLSQRIEDAIKNSRLGVARHFAWTDNGMAILTNYHVMAPDGSMPATHAEHKNGWFDALKPRPAVFHRFFLFLLASSDPRNKGDETTYADLLDTYNEGKANPTVSYSENQSSEDVIISPKYRCFAYVFVFLRKPATDNSRAMPLTMAQASRETNDLMTGNPKHHLEEAGVLGMLKSWRD